ncbi:MAG: hypothetical protein ACFB4I_08390 [Cyanophyceae cyanobacterium]
MFALSPALLLAHRSAVFVVSTALLASLVPTAKAQMASSAVGGSISIEAFPLVVREVRPLPDVVTLPNVINGLTEPARSSRLFFEEGQEELEREIKLLMEQELIDPENLLQIDIDKEEGRFGEEIEKIE